MNKIVYKYLRINPLNDFICNLIGCFCILFSELKLKDNRSFYPSQ